MVRAAPRFPQQQWSSRIMKQALAVLALTLLLALPSLAQTPAAVAAPATVATAPPAALPAGAHACQDFYGATCDGRSGSGPDAAEALAERNRNELRHLLEEPAKPGAQRSGALRRATDFYAACMDEKQITALGLAPLKPELDRIAALHERSQLPGLIAHLDTLGVPALVAFVAQPDPRRGGAVLPVLLAGGTALPDPEIYTSREAEALGLRGRYSSHLTRMFVLLGDSPEQAAKEAAGVLRVETSLARATLTINQEAPEESYRELRRTDLAALARQFDWSAYFAGLGIQPAPALITVNPDYARELGSLLAVVSLDNLRSYLTWQLVHSVADLLPKPFADASFSFFGSVLADLRQAPPRWQRCLGFTQAALPAELGRVYAQRHFDDAARRSAIQLVENLERSLASDLAAVDWLDPATRVQALAKLHAVRNRVGYPERGADANNLNVVAGDALGNWQRSRTAELRRMVANLGKPPDRGQWAGTPAGSNVFYDPVENALEVPAGFLQAPLFSAGGDPAANYGGAGVIIARELSHGFDAAGRRFDAAGHLHEWWSADVGKRFEQHAACFAHELDQVDQGDDDDDDTDIVAERRETLQEVAGDSAGLRIAFDAWRSAVGAPVPAAESPVVQRFFLTYAGLGCGNAGPQATGDGERLRIDAALSNMGEFATAFRCGAKTPMVFTPRCRIW
jgi:putative endopeptidase